MKQIQISNAELRAAVTAEVPRAIELLKALVARPSLRGGEREAQELMATTMAELGFEVERLPIPDSIGEDELAGVPALSYEGRFDVLGKMPHDGGRSLLLNGHIDVVPANDATWSSDPFVPIVRDGWLYGRGAGDMKGGFSMAVLALRALRRLGASAGQRNLSFLSVIEEECTGNGTLAAVRAGVSADAVVLPEPTDLKILLGGVAITWVRIIIRFGGGHAERSDRIVAPAQVIATLIGNFERLEDEYNKDVKPPFDTITRPFNVNVGVVRVGEWPSSVAAVAEMEVRVGHPDDVSDEQVRERVHAFVADAMHEAGNPEFEVSLHGFKTQSYHLATENQLVQEVIGAHLDLHGESPVSALLGSTTDARYYVNQLGVPALCFGPVVKNMHGSNECVELASIELGALTLARFLLNYFNEGGS